MQQKTQRLIYQCNSYFLLCGAYQAYLVTLEVWRAGGDIWNIFFTIIAIIVDQDNL